MNLFSWELKKLIILLKNDMKSLLAGIIAPTIILITFFLIFGNLSELKIAFINESSGNYSKQLEQSIFNQISPLGNKPYFEKIEADKNKAFKLFNEGKISAIVILSESFDQNLKGGKNAHIEYHFNNYNSDTAKNLRLYLKEGILDFYKKTNENIKIKTKEILTVKKIIKWFDIISIGVFVLSFLLGSMFNFLYLFNKEKDYKTLYEYKLSPKNIVYSLFARIIVSLLAGTITGIINAIFIYFLTKINIFIYIPQIIFPLICLGLIYIFFACILALCIDNFSGAAVLSMVGTVVLWFLSGATASIKYTGGILRKIALSIPTTYGLSQMRQIVFQTNLLSSGLPSYRVGWIIIIFHMAFAMWVATYLYVHKLNKKTN